MRLTVLFGSPHENGNTRLLLDAFLSALPAGSETAFFNAYELLPEPCIDCGCCRDSGECVYGDPGGFFGSAMKTDLLVIASPVYHYSFPAPVKALIDRTQRFYAVPEPEKKIPCVLLMCGGAPHSNGVLASKELSHALSSMGAFLYRVVVAPDTDRSGVKEEYRKMAALAAKSILSNQKEEI